ncbi:3-hydroxyacyl-CoA dehydrogenase family protein [Neoactinobaculum massilliense]|uniref:3-hydroxyacyl-CoA dehydrogenase family protein n=1 Tax=Neoactinobaculum massilliense TaxID=2364794 RepID=UPI000F51E943|nr:3-hydroxyacyl-CoA dehydrogenase family protein [Neoactinobaculum massilliense]
MNYSHTFEEVKDRPVTVVGSGTLGRRIALMFATRGGEVRIYDTNPKAGTAAVEYVKETLPSVIEQRGSGEAGRAVAYTSLEDALKGTWLVIEAVPEIPNLKKEVWTQINAAADADTIFATNSSSYASRLLSGPITDKGRFLNTHFYMPPTVTVMDLMSDGETAPEVMDTLKKVLPEYGLDPHEAMKESTGFIANRIWAAIKRESLEVVYEGVSTPADIDAMLGNLVGSDFGPFKLMDQVGLDVVLDIEEHYAAENPHLPEGPRKLLRQYIDAGKLGRKTGEGFYSYK